MVHLRMYLSMQWRVLFLNTYEGVPNEGVPKSALRNLYKEVPEGSFEFELKGALEVKIELHFKLHMLDATVNAQVCTKQLSER